MFERGGREEGGKKGKKGQLVAGKKDGCVCLERNHTAHVAMPGYSNDHVAMHVHDA